MNRIIFLFYFTFLPITCLSLQRIDGITPTSASVDPFERAFEAAIAAVLKIEPTAVTVVGMGASVYGEESTLATYRVSVPLSTVTAVSDAISGSSALKAISYALEKAGFVDVSVEGAPLIVDMSPSSAPTYEPTQAVTIPYFLLSLFMSWRICTVSLLPVHPNG